MQASRNVKVAGIHLTGPNSPKTTLVIMTGRLGEGNLKIDSVHDRLGPQHKLFSDDRLFEILRQEQPDCTMIDSPLSLPPCVACTRPSCPGVIACEDIAVAYMQKLMDSPQGRRRRKPINPQTQRIWDVREWFETNALLQEPTYTANKAPLVVRAMTLQRRLQSLTPPLRLLETSPPHTLVLLAEQWGLDLAMAYEYRSFELGEQRRASWLQAWQARGFLAASKNPAQTILAQVEGFSALLAGLVAYWHVQGKTLEPTHSFFAEQGWVYQPSPGSV